ncbi:hypothetical protein RJ639_018707 [Escallonia herrerae]|uniref:histidine kinase n=1 Tax=Escallonia herrerae TaxID=1293975 RepID=A0AA89AKM3_9ASTE|nr:hypothetical protein RJ639_018707 [Escallonia herrerae]
MTIAKVSTAVVSCATALMLVHIIPDLLSVKKRERLLKDKAEELDRERGLIIKQEETGSHVRMLTHEIRSTLDRHTILKTTLVELGRTLELQECALWMPSQRVPHTCPLARIRPPLGRYAPPEAVAVRVPLLHLSNFQINDWPELSARSYAVMVSILPVNGIRKWRDHGLEHVEVVADQLKGLNLDWKYVTVKMHKWRYSEDRRSIVVMENLAGPLKWESALGAEVAVALSHAAILEESMRAHDQLMEQNVALDLARQEAEMAIRAQNDFLAVMNHEMRTPMHAVIALSSLLLETELTPEQRAMIETILRSSNLLATLINDVLDLSRLEDGSLELDTTIINLPGVFREVIGDEKRLMQTLLIVVGNAVKFTKEGYVSVEASTAKPEYLRNWRSPEFCPTISDENFYLFVQVKDSGCGITPQVIPHLFTKFSASQNASSTWSNGGAGLGLAICKRFVCPMGGHIWIESEGLGKGSKLSYMVKLGICDNPSETAMQQVLLVGTANQGSDDLMGYRHLIKDDCGVVAPNPHYQRSF